jgi:hypothetical protein
VPTSKPRRLLSVAADCSSILSTRGTRSPVSDAEIRRRQRANYAGCRFRLVAIGCGPGPVRHLQPPNASKKMTGQLGVDTPTQLSPTGRRPPIDPRAFRGCGETEATHKISAARSTLRRVPQDAFCASTAVASSAEKQGYLDPSARCSSCGLPDAVRMLAFTAATLVGCQDGYCIVQSSTGSRSLSPRSAIALATTWVGTPAKNGDDGLS